MCPPAPRLAAPPRPAAGPPELMLPPSTSTYEGMQAMMLVALQGEGSGGEGG
jgi:hypothetical protein